MGLSREDPATGEGSPGKANSMPPGSSTLSSDIWKLYEEQASKSRADFVDAWNMQMDSLLLFAALFSAILTAFVVASYPNLQQDTGSTTVELLQVLVAFQLNQTTQPQDLASLINASTPFVPAASAVRVNCFWFAGLVVSVSVAFLAILAKQWLFSLAESLVPTMEVRGRQHQYRYDNMRRWRYAAILGSLPALLHVSLLLFFAGLVDFLWSINETVAIVATSLVGITVTVYIGTHILSITSDASPYKTSVTNAILNGMNAILGELIVDLVTVLIPVVASILIVCRPLLVYYGVVPAGEPGRVASRREALMARTHKLRGELKLSWNNELTTVFDPRSWEQDYIAEHADLVDARVLARMIESFPSTDERAELITREVSRYPHLLRFRRLLFASGAVRLLTRRLRSIYVGKFRELPPALQKETLDYSRTLARLLTEAEEGESVINSIQGIPIVFKGYFEYVEEDDIAAGLTGSSSSSSTSTGSLLLAGSSLCVADAAVSDTDDLVFFSQLLRLQLVASSPKWYAREVYQSVKDFYRRLEDFIDLNVLSEDDSMSLLNAAIYVATRSIELDTPASNEDLQKAAGEHRAMALNALSSLMLGNHGMSLPHLWQICWALPMLSMSTAYLTSELVPQISEAKQLAGPLARLLSMNKRRPPLLHAVLALLEHLLYPKTDGPTGGERDDHARLLKTLTDRYPVFLQEFRADLPEALEHMGDPAGSSVLEQFTANDLQRLLQRIVWISSHLGQAQDSGQELEIPRVDRERITHDTLDILLYVCECHEVRCSQEWEAIWLSALDAVSELVLLHAEGASLSGPARDDGTHSASVCEAMASKVSAALNSAAASTVLPETINTLLSLLALSSTTFSKATRNISGAQLEIVSRSVSILGQKPIFQKEAARALNALSSVLSAISDDSGI